LDPALKKGAWTEYEDATIIQWCKKNGPKNWTDLAALLPGRTGKRCRERWTNKLNPDANRGPWTPEEDRKLMALHGEHGNRWMTIASGIPGRTDGQCRDRWATVRDRPDVPPFAPPPPPPPFAPPPPLPMPGDGAALELLDGPPPLMLWADAPFGPSDGLLPLSMLGADEPFHRDLPLQSGFVAPFELFDGQPPLSMLGADATFDLPLQSEFMPHFDFLDEPPQPPAPPQQQPAARKRSSWTQAEDEAITEHVRRNGPKNWTAIAQQLPSGRIGKQCRERWVNHLDPDVKQDPWTTAEDALIVQLQAQLGNKWGVIASRLTDRTGDQVKNRWNNQLKERTDPTVPKTSGRQRKQPAPPPSPPAATGNPTGEELPPQQGQSPGGRNPANPYGFDPANPYGFDLLRTFVQ
jgi:hypothetical protein